jgi:hypothetical protein
MYVRGTPCDVSARFLGVYVGGFAIWLLYGLGIESAPIVLVYAVGLVCGSITLSVLLWLRKPVVAVAKRPAGEDPAASGKEAMRQWNTSAQPCT